VTLVSLVIGPGGLVRLIDSTVGGTSPSPTSAVRVDKFFEAWEGAIRVWFQGRADQKCM
jgi:hypothetical protein